MIKEERQEKIEQLILELYDLIYEEMEDPENSNADYRAYKKLEVAMNKVMFQHDYDFYSPFV